MNTGFSQTLLQTPKYKSFFVFVIALASFVNVAESQQPQRVVKPNYLQAAQYSSNYLRQFMYDTSVRPNWIGETDEFWYAYRTSSGRHFYRVDPSKAQKQPLFDRTKLASQLSVILKKPLDPSQLNLSRMEVDDEGKSLKFVVEKIQYQWDFASDQLKKLGKPPAASSSRARAANTSREELLRRFRERQRGQTGQTQSAAERRNWHRVFSPDRTAYVFAKGHNLYLVELPKGYKAPEEDEESKENSDEDADKGKSDSDQSDKNQSDKDKNDNNSDAKKRESKGGADKKDTEDDKGQTKETKADARKSRQKKRDDQSKSRARREAKKSSREQDGNKSRKKTTEAKQNRAKSRQKETDKSADNQDNKRDRSQLEKDGQSDSGQDREKNDKTKQKSAKKDVKEKKDVKQKEDSDKKDADKKDTDKEDSDKEDSDKEDSDKEDSDKEDSNKEDSNKEDSNKEDSNKEDSDKEDSKKEDTDKKESKKEDSDKEKELPIPKVEAKMDATATQITKDGIENYSFAGRPRSRGQNRSRSQQAEPIKDDQKTRPSVNWSKDSKAFYVSRRDSRDVKELWVINSLAKPRPTIEKYPYPMPGDDKVRKSELNYFKRAKKKFSKLQPKWDDEGYSNVHFGGETSDHLFFIRRDRLLRNVEFCELDLKSGKTKCLIEEGFENTNIAPQSVRHLKETGELIWWSERSGWGHFYLYDKTGKLKNAITSGNFRAARVVDVDEENRLLYFTGNAREPGENIYHRHLYQVRLDGTGLSLMDPGNANHSSTLSPSKQFLVDNCSRVDIKPVSILRSADGSEILKLEEADLSRLEQVGWQMPETFTVKAADGVTDLYGNMWKPFNFDSQKQYPIIAHVYPGPQQEGTRHTFSATAGEQQLAQLGFIVIQVGHRGGTPTRSKSYAAFGYYNLRDYGLADKKAAMEQLAQRFPFIDIQRTGIYGHSGGGFMTAAAMMKEPYNTFFKVGVATAGNHDNNIYNYSWSEQYHGLKVVKGDQKGRQTGSDDENSENQNQDQNNRRRRGGTGPFDVSRTDHFYEFEMLNDDDIEDLDGLSDQAFWEEPELMLALQSEQENQRQDKDQSKEDQKSKSGDDTKGDDKKSADAQQQRRGQRRRNAQRNAKQKKVDDQVDRQQDTNDKDSKQKKQSQKKDQQKSGDQDSQKESNKQKQNDVKSKEKSTDETKEKQDQTRYEIKVPTNAELAENLKGHLFLIHGELDNNVHPANTLRLVDALIRANKRFDMLYLPATRHGFGEYQPYVTQRMYEYFAEHLLDDYQGGIDITEKSSPND